MVHISSYSILLLFLYFVHNKGKNYLIFLKDFVSIKNNFSIKIKAIKFISRIDKVFNNDK